MSYFEASHGALFRMRIDFPRTVKMATTDNSSFEYHEFVHGEVILFESIGVNAYAY